MLRQRKKDSPFFVKNFGLTILQEKVYNPFYTLAIQQLCRISHSHKVTLQFCLWDFLRNLGETNVGGADVVKHMEDEPDFNVSRVTSTRLTNVAIAYAWWVSKGSVSLTIFKA